MQLFANGQRCDDISEYGRCCFLYSLLKPAEWYRNKGITGFWEVGGAPAPVPAESFKDVLMAPTLIGMFQAGKFLPPQLNLTLELEFSEAADALRPGEGFDGLHHRKRPGPREPGHPRFGIVRKLPKNPPLGAQLGFRVSHNAHAGLQHPRRQHFSQRDSGSSFHKITRCLRHLPGHRRFARRMLQSGASRRREPVLGELPGVPDAAGHAPVPSLPRYPMASDAEHFHFLEILAGTYDSTIKNMRIADNQWNNNQFICSFPVERVPKHPLSGISTYCSQTVLA